MIRKLVFLDPAGVWQLAFEGPTCTLGRDEGNTVKLDDPQVSRRHALLELREDGTVWVVDLHSRNGVFRNGVRVPVSSPLVNRDVLEIGTTKIRFLETPAAPASTQLGFLWDGPTRPGIARMAVSAA